MKNVKNFLLLNKLKLVNNKRNVDISFNQIGLYSLPKDEYPGIFTAIATGNNIYSGKIKVLNDHNVYKSINRDKHVYYINKSFSLSNSTSIDSQLLFLSRSYSKELSLEDLNDLFVKLQIESYLYILDNKFSELNDEEKFIASLLCAYISNCPIILLDKIEIKDELIYRLIRNISEERLIISNVLLNDLQTIKNINDSTSIDMNKKKPHLSFSEKSKLSLVTFKKNKVLAIIASVFITLSMMISGLISADNNANTVLDELNLLEKNNISDVIIAPDSYSSATRFDFRNLRHYYQYKIKNFNGDQSAQIRLYINSNKNERPIYLYNPIYFSKKLPFGIDVSSVSISNTSTPSELLKCDFKGALYLDDPRDLSWEFDKRINDQSICHNPEKEDEIAITALKADYFMKNGLPNETTFTESIEKVEDLIGKKLFSYTITAVYENRSDINPEREIKKSKQRINSYDSDLYVSNCIVASCPEKYKNKESKEAEEDLTGIYLKLQKHKENVKLLKDLKSEQHITHHSNYRYEGAKDRHYYYNCKLLSPYSSIIRNSSYKGQVDFYYVAICFSTFYLLIAIILITISIKKDDKYIKSLQAYNMNRSTRIQIGLLKISIIALSSLIVSLILTSIMFIIFNSLLLCPHFKIEIFFILELLFIPFMTSFIPLLISKTYRFKSKLK